eukprot:10970688-Alexandrium_andersonii.AAC.1
MALRSQVGFSHVYETWGAEASVRPENGTRQHFGARVDCPSGGTRRPRSRLWAAWRGASSAGRVRAPSGGFVVLKWPGEELG